MKILPTVKKKPNILAIIPARGGSKGLPRKNIRDLCGKPLIAYSIEVALNSQLINRVIVSTEDEEIAEISKHYGAEVPFLRPVEMAQDQSNITDAINYTVNNLQKDGYYHNILIALFPTHPFRTAKLMDFLVEKNLQGYYSVNTVKQIKHNDISIFSKNKNQTLTSLLSMNTLNHSQHKKTFFREYGLYIGTGYNSKNAFYLHTIKDPIGLIDIDSLSDFILAEEVIKERLFNFKGSYLLDNPHGKFEH